LRLSYPIASGLTVGWPAGFPWAICSVAVLCGAGELIAVEVGRGLGSTVFSSCAAAVAVTMLSVEVGATAGSAGLVGVGVARRVMLQAIITRIVNKTHKIFHVFLFILFLSPKSSRPTTPSSLGTVVPALINYKLSTMNQCPLTPDSLLTDGSFSSHPFSSGVHKNHHIFPKNSTLMQLQFSLPLS